MVYLTTDIFDLLTSENIEDLNKANIWTINDLYSIESYMEIKQITNMKYHLIRELYDKVKQRYALPCHDLKFLLEKNIQECKMCPTGLPELTQALDGGFQTQEIVELFGDSECGKTEMCYLLCGQILSHFEDYHIMFIASSFDIDHEKIAKYTKCKGGGRDLSEDEIFKALQRVEIARPTKLADLVHLLNTLVHSDRRNKIKCLIIDSLSFIIQEDLLRIKTSNLDDGDELEKFSALKGLSAICKENGATVENTRKDLIETYLHEVLRLITNIAITKNVIVVFTNSDSHLTSSKSWTNAVDHRIHLTRISEFSRYCLHNPQSTVCKATILKTIHNISKIGYSIPFAINDEGLFAIRLAPARQPSTDKESSSESS